eukprot:11212046-Lingulodinium_polyedra.AAC.1
MKECASYTAYAQMAEPMKTFYKEFRTLKRNQGSLGRAGTRRATRGRTAYGVESDIGTFEDDPSRHLHTLLPSQK